MTDEPEDDLDRDAEEPALELSDPRYWERALSAAGAGAATSSYLLQDSAVAAAIATGKAARVRDVLARKHAEAKSEADRGALAALLADRRLFLEPAGSGPTMWTLNGCGTRCYGSQDKNPADGTYITTYFFTFLFLPIWPFRQYLVADAEGGGWFFLGKVPTSSFHRWWRRLVLAGAAAVACVIGLLAWDRSTHDQVHFLNGLPFAVTVAMGDYEATVPPGGRTTHEFEKGRYDIVARGADGAVLEETDASVPGGMDLVAYNVLGSAPLYLQVIAYAGESVGDDERAAKESVKSLAGQPWVTLDDLDYVFEDPPDTIDISSRSAVATRRLANVFGDGTWVEAAGHLASDGDMVRASELGRRVALLDPSDVIAVERAYALTAGLGDAATTRSFLETVIAAVPDAVQPHRIYQTHMEQQGAEDEILARYRAAHEADPTSATAGYLYARLLPLADALPIYEALLPANPDDVWLLRGAGWVYFQMGRFDAAAPLLESHLALDASEAGHLVPRLARALVGAGRPRDALETVEGLLSVEGLGGASPWTLMALYASLRRLLPDVPFATVEEHWKPFLEDDPGAGILVETAALGRDAENVAALRDEVDDPEVLRYCDMVLLSRTDVGAAAKLALLAAPETLQRMDDAAQIAIACELQRGGHEARAKQVLSGLFPESAQYVSFADVVALPDVSGVSEDLDVGLRAALLVAASHRTDDAATKAELLAEARRLDVLRQVVPD